MNSLVVVNICIVLLHLCILVNLISASELGISSCRYSGKIDENGTYCHKDVVKIETLPKQCLSFVYYGVVCNENYTIELDDPKYGLERLKSLVEFEGRSHPVFLFFSHGNSDNWYDIVLNGDYSRVAQNVQNLTRDNPVKGLILHGIDQFSLSDIAENFHQEVKSYVKTIKEMNPNLEIGLYLSARSLMDETNGMDHLLKLDPTMDFFLIEFHSFNNCVDELLHGGTTPMDSPNSNVFTLNKFAGFLDSSTIAKDKIFFEFLISPLPRLEDQQYFKNCEVSYNEYCKNEDNQIKTWCVDNTDILYKKGAFTQKYAKGFVGSYIDLVDRDDKCKCGKYSTFDMMVNGFNGETDPKNCDALKGS